MSQSIGNGSELEFKIGHKLRSVPITSHGEWSLAFEAFAEAIRVLLPPLYPVLPAYRRHIVNFFSQLDIGAHLRIINHEAAVRLYLTTSTCLTLQDFHHSELQPLHNVHFTMGTSAVQTFSSSEKRKRPSEENAGETCRRYNQGKCPNRNCRYKHICSSCGGSHALSDDLYDAQRGRKMVKA